MIITAIKEKFIIALMAPMVLSAFANAIIGLGYYRSIQVFKYTLNYKRVGGTMRYKYIGYLLYDCGYFSHADVPLDKPVYRVLLSGITILFSLPCFDKIPGGYIVGFSAVLILLIIQAKVISLKPQLLFLFGSSFLDYAEIVPRPHPRTL